MDGLLTVRPEVVCSGLGSTSEDSPASNIIVRSNLMSGPQYADLC